MTNEIYKQGLLTISDGQQYPGGPGITITVDEYDGKNAMCMSESLGPDQARALGLALLARFGTGRVPRALTDVQRRGGKGTP